MRVDGVITDHPCNRAGVQRNCRRINSAECDRKSHQRSPGKRQAEHDLRPPGNPLHKRVDCDHNQGRNTDRHREQIELQQHCQPDQRLKNQKTQGLRHTHLPRRYRPRARPLNPCVEIAIGDVVPGATGAAHDECANEEQRKHQGQLANAVSHAGGDRRRPPARHQQ